MRRYFAPVFALLLASCAAIPTAPAPPPRPPGQNQVIPPNNAAPPPPTGFIAPRILHAPGLKGVIRANAASLIHQFGRPRLDTREADMRKLQFSGTACVLDVYLYPLRPGAKPVATWVEARRASDGLPVDRGACVRALRKRPARR